MILHHVLPKLLSVQLRNSKKGIPSAAVKLTDKLAIKKY